MKNSQATNRNEFKVENIFYKIGKKATKNRMKH